MKDEESARRNAPEADQVIPFDGLAQIQNRIYGENRQGNHFLKGLQLRPAGGAVAEFLEWTYASGPTVAEHLGCATLPHEILTNAASEVTTLD